MSRTGNVNDHQTLTFRPSPQPRAPLEKSAHLPLLLDDNGPAQRIAMHDPRVAIGRITPVDVVPAGHTVICRHCQLAWHDNDQIVPSDLGSIHGTFVDDGSIEAPTVLHDDPGTAPHVRSRRAPSRVPAAPWRAGSRAAGRSELRCRHTPRPSGHGHRIQIPIGSALAPFSGSVFGFVAQNGRPCGLQDALLFLPAMARPGGLSRLHDRVRQMARPGPLKHDSRPSWCGSMAGAGWLRVAAPTGWPT